MCRLFAMIAVGFIHGAPSSWNHLSAFIWAFAKVTATWANSLPRRTLASCASERLSDPAGRSSALMRLLTRILKAIEKDELGGPRCNTDTHPSRIKPKTTMKKPGSKRLNAFV